MQQQFDKQQAELQLEKQKQDAKLQMSQEKAQFQMRTKGMAAEQVRLWFW